MNKVTLVGRLTDDVELRYTPNGVAVGNFTLAVNRKFKNQNGEYDADFIRCTVWRKTAEALAQHQKKGDRIAVAGSIETGSYQDKETGKTIYTTIVRADEVSFLSPSRGGQGNGQPQNAPQQGGNPYQQMPQGGQQMANKQPQGQVQGQQQMPQGNPNQGGNPYQQMPPQGGQQMANKQSQQQGGQQAPFSDPIELSDQDLPF